jgi:hypothetical protein
MEELCGEVKDFVGFHVSTGAGARDRLDAQSVPSLALTRMRQADTIDRRQRLIAVLLLAFAIDSVRPLVDPTTHRHAGGDRPHVHAGGVSGGSGHTLLFSSGLTRQPLASGIHVLPASDTAPRHAHLYRPLQVAHVVPPPALPALAERPPIHARTRDDVRAATGRPASARAPPPLLA